MCVQLNHLRAHEHTQHLHHTAAQRHRSADLVEQTRDGKAAPMAQVRKRWWQRRRFWRAASI